MTATTSRARDGSRRVSRAETLPPAARRTVPRLVSVALRGLRAMGIAGGTDVPHTLRGHRSARGPVLVPEGNSLRYAAIVALGLATRDVETQRTVLGGGTAADLARSCLRACESPRTEAGAVALALWAAGEVLGESDAGLVDRLAATVQAPRVPAVTCAWALCAALALPDAAGHAALAELATGRLLTARGPRGTYPHLLPGGGGWRAHVGSFADQVYPLQALARRAAADADAACLAAANATAAQLARLQGPAGQWWWHYDARDGGVVERYPVYSVHQHGMAPMALFELAEAGGEDHRGAAARGLHWLETHPECMEPLIADDLGVVWRKVGRREVAKAARGLAALTTRVRPGLRPPALDAVFPPGAVDHECRPYELGWLLYAWPDAGVHREETG